MTHDPEQGHGKIVDGGVEPHQASFRQVADEPSTLPAISSNQRPERNIIAGSAGGPPAWLMTPAVAQAPSATLPWPCDPESLLFCDGRFSASTSGCMSRVTETRIRRIFADSISVKRQFLRDNLDALAAVIAALAGAFRAGNKLLLFGNGGSAADAQHIAAEFVNRFKMERRPLPALALTTDSSALTSIANDYHYDQVFSKQVEALANKGDVAIAISTSGNARNVLRAVSACRRRGVIVVALTGGSGGKLVAHADHVLCAGASTQTARIQETHILAGHVICELVDEALFGAPPSL